MQSTNMIDKWLNNNSFDVSDFSNYTELYLLKIKKKLTISVIIPTLEEEKTIGNILNILISKLILEVPLIDEIMVVDGGSNDATISICEGFSEHVKLVHEKNILPNADTSKGKGNQLWKGLYICNSDIVVYMDSDLKNFNERFVIGIIGPLLKTDIKFIKGFYERKLSSSQTVTNNGGRVTELCARPLLNMVYPELSGFIQPLGGEYGGYTNVLKKIHYSSGYGVEVKLLIEIFNNFGLDVMGQVNLYSKEHDHQPLNALSKMSYTIMKTILNSKFYDLNLNNNSLLIKNITNNDNTNIKIRSEEHIQCNSTGRDMCNNYFKYCEINEKVLIPIEFINNSNNDNKYNLYL